eukprot:Rhum_TRINITY_DN14144_c16_g1::Rhum_TRINITY_DN14144_c16_g1_i1::g.70823::m.70823
MGHRICTGELLRVYASCAGDWFEEAAEVWEGADCVNEDSAAAMLACCCTTRQVCEVHEICAECSPPVPANYPLAISLCVPNPRRAEMLFAHLNALHKEEARTGPLASLTLSAEQLLSVYARAATRGFDAAAAFAKAKEVYATHVAGSPLQDADDAVADADAVLAAPAAAGAAAAADAPLAAVLACSPDRAAAVETLNRIVQRMQRQAQVCGDSGEERCPRRAEVARSLESAFVAALNLSADDGERADMLFRLGFVCGACSGEEGGRPDGALGVHLPLEPSTPALLALLKALAKARVGKVRAEEVLARVREPCACVLARSASTPMTCEEDEPAGLAGFDEMDAGVLGLLFACCETEAEVAELRESARCASAAPATLAQALEWHFGGLTEKLYKTLAEVCEPDEWCCQALFRALSRASFLGVDGVDFKRVLYAFRAMVRHLSGPINEWTVAAALACCATSAQAAEVLNHSSLKSCREDEAPYLNATFARAIESLRSLLVHNHVLASDCQGEHGGLANGVVAAAKTLHTLYLDVLLSARVARQCRQQRLHDLNDTESSGDCDSGQREKHNRKCPYLMPLPMLAATFRIIRGKHPSFLKTIRWGRGGALHAARKREKPPAGTGGAASPEDTLALSRYLVSPTGTEIMSDEGARFPPGELPVLERAHDESCESDFEDDLKGIIPPSFVKGRRRERVLLSVRASKNSFVTASYEEQDGVLWEFSYTQQRHRAVPAAARPSSAARSQPSSPSSAGSPARHNGFFVKGASLTGTSIDAARPSAASARQGSRCCYVTDSENRLLDERYAGMVQHMKLFNSGRTWVLSSYNEATHKWDCNAGEGRLSALTQSIRVYILKYWLERTSTAYVCKAAEYLNREEALNVLKAIEMSRATLTPKSDSAHSRQKRGKARKGKVQIVDHRGPPKKGPLPHDFAGGASAPSMLSPDKVAKTAPTPVAGDPTNPFIYAPNEGTDRTSLTVAYNYELKRKGGAPVLRGDIIRSETVRQMLHPLKDYFHCSEALAEEEVSLEDFVAEVLSRLCRKVGPDGEATMVPSVQVKHGGASSGDVHRAVPGMAVQQASTMQGSMRRRKLATKFLGGIVSECDPFVKDKVKDWMAASTAAAKLATTSEAAPSFTVSGVPSDHGLLLGFPPQLRGEHDSGKDARAEEEKTPAYSKHGDIADWKAKEDVVQPLILRVAGIPFFACSYVQTFETRAEKAEKKRLEKHRRDQDALGLLLPDGGDERHAGKKLYTLASIKSTIAARRETKKRMQPIFYKMLLEQPSAFRVSDGDEGAVGADDELTELSGAKHTDDASHDRRGGSELGKGSSDDGASDSTPHSYMRFEEYDPNLLDDPEIKSEKKRKLLSIPTLRATVIPYSKPKDLKEDVNQQFLLTHPWIEETGLSLTGIRKAKMIMINLALKDTPPIEAATVAYAVVYFEKLILKRIVTKANRKLVAAVCCVLAFKFWESDASGSSKELAGLLSDLVEHFDVPRKRILQAEFKIYALLNFDLLVPLKLAKPHFHRLLALYSITYEEFFSKKDNSWGLSLREEGTAPVVKATHQ